MKVMLQPEPTFKASVQIHVPGQGPTEMEWTFVYRSQKELQRLSQKWNSVANAEDKAKQDDLRTIAAKNAIAAVMDLAKGWELDEPFNRKNVELFFDHYPTAWIRILEKYFDEVYGARRKN